MISFFISGRQSGKTKRLIEWANGNKNRYIIVHSYAAKFSLLKQAEEMQMEIDPHNIISVDMAKAGFLQGSTCEVAIDNLDLILSYLIYAPVEIVTATGMTVN